MINNSGISPSIGVKAGAPSIANRRGTPTGLSELLRSGTPVRGNFISRAMPSVGQALPPPIGAPATAFGAPSGTNSFMLHAGRNFAEGGLVGADGQPVQAGVSQGAPMGADQLQSQLQQFIQQNPEAVAKIRDAIMEALNSGSVTQQDLELAVQMAMTAAQNPDMYPRLRQMAIQKGLATEEELPPQYDQGVVFAILIAGEALKAGPPQQAGLTPPAPQQAPMNMAAGGEVPNHRGDAAGVADSVAINVSEGEYVIPAEVVHRKGTDFFDKMIGRDESAKKQ